ncbi:hypothetical protein [Sphingomonas sp. Leaf25]|uniref:hypothetical protein n=1 Tax=Sphingomonas sp. Leaf25 TaxID=1735692 RepID=UPI0012E155C0|nr:hypothetical protein [Sphingomonas sp. Leaf25]
MILSQQFFTIEPAIRHHPRKHELVAAKTPKTCLSSSSPLRIRAFADDGRSIIRAFADDAMIGVRA